MESKLQPRQTVQRQAIRSVLGDAAGPLTPQEIHELALQQMPTLGLATVYRNLSYLQEEGEVRAVHLPGEPARFEPATDQHQHHFHCSRCEGVFVIRQPCPLEFLEGATLPGGFQVADHAITFYGVCPDCADVPTA